MQRASGRPGGLGRLPAVVNHSIDASKNIADCAAKTESRHFEPVDTLWTSRFTCANPLAMTAS
jgi:hypothetical protein